MAVGRPPSRSIEETPTWAVATVCFIIVSISIFLEHSIHLLTEWLHKHKRTALYDAVWKIKSELRRLGFLSLLLAVFQDPISKICIPYDVANTMLPCSKEAIDISLATYVHSIDQFDASFSNNNYLKIDDSYDHQINNITKFRSSSSYRRILAYDAGVGEMKANNATAMDSCGSQGKVALVTEKGIQQLQIFIFVLAVMQIVHSVLTMAFGRAKMRRWKVWEQETQTLEYQIANDPSRFRFTRQTTFGRRHSSCTETSLQLWTKCFFRQFFHSVAKVDYLTLRHGFIMAHFSTRFNNFNFQKYIERSLDEDFKLVVSISSLMWFLVVIFMLVDVHGWHSYLWISYVPLLMVLVLGTKLEVIVSRMALRLKNRNNVTIGAPMVEPNDDLFWFQRPRLVLNLLHLALFVNAFEMAFFIWVTIQFGFDSCYHEHIGMIIARIIIAVVVQILCSYITLPLYALVTQMGSKFNSKIMNDQTAQILRQWHAQVRNKRKGKELVRLAPCPRIGPTRISSQNRPTPTPDERPSTSNKLEIVEEQTEENIEIVETSAS